MQKLKQILILFGVIGAVAGCGGSSDSSGGGALSTAAIQITPANASNVAKSANVSTQGMVTTNQAAAAVGVVTVGADHSINMLDFARLKFKKISSLQPNSVAAGLLQNFNCDVSGTYTVDSPSIGSIGMRAGDVITISFSNCVDLFGTSNGSISFVINSYSGGDPVTGFATVANPISASFTMTLSNFTNVDAVTSESTAMSGDMTFSISDDGDIASGSMSGRSLSIVSTSNGALAMSSYSMVFSDTFSTGAFNYEFNMTTASIIAGGSITIATTTPFTGNEALFGGNPTAGVMVITGANNSTLTITANPDGVHVGMIVDEDGAAGPLVPEVVINPATNQDFTWDEI